MNTKTPPPPARPVAFTGGGIAQSQAQIPDFDAWAKVFRPNINRNPDPRDVAAVNANAEAAQAYNEYRSQMNSDYIWMVRFNDALKNGQTFSEPKPSGFDSRHTADGTPRLSVSPVANTTANSGQSVLGQNLSSHFNPVGYLKLDDGKGNYLPNPAVYVAPGFDGQNAYGLDLSGSQMILDWLKANGFPNATLVEQKRDGKTTSPIYYVSIPGQGEFLAGGIARNIVSTGETYALQSFTAEARRGAGTSSSQFQPLTQGSAGLLQIGANMEVYGPGSSGTIKIGVGQSAFQQVVNSVTNTNSGQGGSAIGQNTAIQSQLVSSFSIQNVNSPGATNLAVGESWQITILGQPGKKIYVSATQTLPNGTAQNLSTEEFGTIGSDGKLVRTKAVGTEHIGFWQEIWSVGDSQDTATQFTTLNFSVVAVRNQNTPPVTPNPTTANTTIALPPATVGVAYNVPIPGSWALVGTNSPNITITNSNGIYSFTGTPRQAGTFTFSLMNTQTLQSQSYTVVVNPASTTAPVNPSTGPVDNSGSSFWNNLGNTNPGNSNSAGTGGSLGNATTGTNPATTPDYSSQIIQLNDTINQLQNRINALSQAPAGSSGLSAQQLADLQKELTRMRYEMMMMQNNNPVNAQTFGRVEGVSTPFVGLRMPEGYNNNSEEQSQPADSVGSYTVKKGDTLWGIAQKYYGDGKKWRKILQANSDKIKNPRTMKVGITLIIPK